MTFRGQHTLALYTKCVMLVGVARLIYLFVNVSAYKSLINQLPSFYNAQSSRHRAAKKFFGVTKIVN